MCKRFACLISIVLVLGLAGGASADLLVHWALEEGSGTTATDSSGNGNNGTFVGTPQWVEGQIGGGLHFDGDAAASSVVYTLPGGATVWTTGTIAIWVKADSLGQDNYSSCFTNHTPNTAGIQLDVDGGTPGNYRLNPGGQFFGPATTEWTHLALTFEDGTGTFYYNGIEATTATVDDSQRTFNEFAIGINRNHSNWLAGTIDELRVYDHPLTADEIQTIMVSGAGRLPHARRPDPADGATLEQTWVSLAWGPGDGAVSHDLYFGTNLDDVNAGAEGTFVANLATTQQVVGFPGFPAPEGLQPGTTYHWRIDEVNDADPNSPWKGDIWSFTVPPRTAYNFVPADGAKFQLPDPTLSWTAGFDAKLHHVYFGDNAADVEAGAPTTYKGPAADITYAPGALEPDKVYYWRIDEFDGVNTNQGAVSSFATLPEVAITDPALMGWWTFEEGTGSTAVDWSGHGNHGTLIGEPQRVAGFDGGALEFGGDNYVDTGYTENLATWTIACWVKSPQAPGGGAASGPMHRESNYQFNWNHQNEIYRSGAAINTGGWQGASYAPLQANRWYHLAATYDGNALIAYRDGVLITTNMAATGTPNAESNSLKFARHAANASQFFTGTVDEARVYNRTLTADEIAEVMKGDTSIAWAPNPGNGTMLEIGDVLPLSWSAGDNASQHDVYFGTDKDAVANADASDASGIYRGRQGAATFNPAEGVEWGGGPYYWRVDESNTDGTIGTGKLWTFAVTDYLLVDGFEDYNNYPPDEIWNTWIDGFQIPTNGALVGYGDDVVQAGGDYAETSIINSGAQSMPLFFDNNLVTSEATKTLTPADNWTREGVAELSLWIRGDTANPAEQIYVALNGVAVFHDDPAVAQATSWTQWRIPLSAFADQGVNLAAINTVSVGLGDKNNLTAGGSGVLYVDDIRLVR